MKINLIPRRRSHRILAGIAAILLVLYAFAGFFVVPRVARTQIEAFVGETLHRKIAIGEIQFNPFTLAVTLTDLKLTEVDGTPLVGFQRLYVNAELASIWRRGVVLKEIELVGPDVELIVAPDGSLNLAALAPPPAAPQPAAAPKPDDKPLRVEIGRFTLEDGRVGLQDRSLAQPFVAALTPLRFQLLDFSTEIGHSNAYSFSAQSRIGARIEWAGGFTMEPLGSSGNFSVSDLRLAAVDKYLEGKLPVDLASGSVELRGRYKFALQPLSLDVVLPSVRVRDLVVAERGVAATPPVAVPEIDVQELSFSLGRRDVGVRRVDVRRARVGVVRESDGSLNLARLAPPASPPSAEPAKPQAPWTVHVDSIAIDAATVVLEDRTLSPAARLQLSPIRVTVDGWTTASKARMKVDTLIGIEGKGSLGVRGDVGLEPLSAALAIDLQRFPLPVLQPYLAQSTGLTLQSGTLGVKAKVALAPGRAGKSPAARVSADVRIDELRTTDDLLKEDLVKWRSLAISGIQFQQGPDRLAIESIVAQEPYARIIVAQNGTTNIARALTPPAGTAPAEPPPAAKPPEAGAAKPPMPVSIRSIRVVDGSANFADYSIEPSFAAGIIGLGGEVTGLSSAPESRARVALKGRVDEFSPVEVAGEINVLSAAMYTDLAVAFRNIELTTFNPYSGKFAGYNISKGKLSAEMKYRVDKRKLDATHHVVVDNLEFGEATGSKDAAPIPIKLGVALLKDRRGVIEIDLPIGGSLDDPEFHFGATIGKGLLNMLARVIASPFKAIGAMFGGSDELAFVDFQPGSAALDEAQAKKLGTLAKALVERPQLRLNVPLTIATASDGDAMARQALRELVPPPDPAKPLDESATRKRFEALEVVYREQLKNAPEYPRDMQGEETPQLDAKSKWLQAALYEHLKPTPAALEGLGRARASGVQGALLANKELAPERVFLVMKPAEASSAAGAVRMEMKLE